MMMNVFRRFSASGRCAGLWRLRVRVLSTRILAAVIGGTFGLIVAPHSWAAFAIATILGLIVAEAIQRGT